jgi:ligand-binding sensor domain-containing protein
VAVGSGRPGVAVKPVCVLAASTVWAEAVYNPFNVANGSGVAEFKGRLQAIWTTVTDATKRMRKYFFVDMGSSEEWFSRDLRRVSSVKGSQKKSQRALALLVIICNRR